MNFRSAGIRPFPVTLPQHGGGVEAHFRCPVLQIAKRWSQSLGRDAKHVGLANGGRGQRLAGHEGGGLELAKALGQALGADPIHRALDIREAPLPVDQGDKHR